MEPNQEGLANGEGQEPGDEAQPPIDEAQPPKATLRSRQSVAARVLVACEHGEPNDVVTLPYGAARAAVSAGRVDPDSDAVAYALSLKQ